MSKEIVVLIILDGWGIGPNNRSNPIHAANPSTINFIKSHYLSGALQASGIAVGLPWGEAGNSEVGHLTLGAGKVLYQHYPRITIAIQNSQFFKNKTLLAAVDYARRNKSAVNLAGLVSESHTHSSLEHLLALIKLIRSVDNKIPIKLHIFSDGKDSPPHSLLKLLDRLPALPLASLAGRYFAMDHNHHWDRTQEVYYAMIGKKKRINNFKEYIQQQYNEGLTDAYLPPVSGACSLENKDSLIFFNFQEDGLKQLTALIEKNTPPSLLITTFTQYLEQSRAKIAFPQEKITQPLGTVLAKAGKIQLRIAETERYAHVTYFFNGLTEKPNKNEFRILVPSRNLAKPEEHPEMMANEITNRVIQALEEGGADFILANFANPDVIAHTGNFQAAVGVVKIIDEQLRKILKAVTATNATAIITSSHGNIEVVRDPITGEIQTEHDANPVPIYLIGKKFAKLTPVTIKKEEVIGMLEDVAPTILDIFNLPPAPEMTGQSLLGRLQ